MHLARKHIRQQRSLKRKYPNGPPPPPLQSITARKKKMRNNNNNSTSMSQASGSSRSLRKSLQPVKTLTKKAGRQTRQARNAVVDAAKWVFNEGKELVESAFDVSEEAKILAQHFFETKAGQAFLEELGIPPGTYNVLKALKDFLNVDGPGDEVNLIINGMAMMQSATGNIAGSSLGQGLGASISSSGMIDMLVDNLPFGELADDVRKANALAEAISTGVLSAPSVLLNGLAGEGYHYPGSNYIGPGTPVMSAGPPVNEMDAAARVHDIQYEWLQHHGIDPYFTWNQSDVELLNKADLNTPEGWAVYLAMTAKQKMFPAEMTPVPAVPAYGENDALTMSIFNGTAPVPGQEKPMSANPMLAGAQNNVSSLTLGPRPQGGGSATTPAGLTAQYMFPGATPLYYQPPQPPPTPPPPTVPQTSSTTAPPPPAAAAATQSAPPPPPPPAPPTPGTTSLELMNPQAGAGAAPTTSDPTLTITKDPNAPPPQLTTPIALQGEGDPNPKPEQGPLTYDPTQRVKNPDGTFSQREISMEGRTMSRDLQQQFMNDVNRVTRNLTPTQERAYLTHQLQSMTSLFVKGSHPLLRGITHPM